MPPSKKFQLKLIPPEKPEIVETDKKEAGLLLLFPSWLKHNVVGNLSQKERYSLSFNFTPRQQPVMQDGQQN